MSVSTRVIKTVGVVGTGVIGASWAAYFLAQGLAVRATDPSAGAHERLLASIDALWPSLERIGLAPGADKQRIEFFADLDTALSGIDFVQENGPEKEDLKIDLFKRMDAVLDADIVLASSSSGLLMSRIQSACRFPERVVLGHPFNPPHLIPLVEVIGGAKTSPDVVERTMRFYADIGKRPIHPRKEVKGHIANRLQAALWREAFNLVDQGVASVSDIDAAIAHGPGLRWALLGPFMNLHLSGGAAGIEHLLDHLGGPIEDWWHDLGDPSMTPELKKKVAQGVREMLQTHAEQDFVPERDRLLVDLLAAKTDSGQLP
ncbi:3-hydroxyacyl-CoA dehydrogenase NAD-binding domain-containing protein [Pusillimonas sp. NJUB218]|uniref:3-hydroxyacyl-CoA dehydrogenase NAD-binding domain-containing protein n=1 Tax=Pusillimonas sp. NJUB218 TaxID=2023230 RepID=UPI000F4CEB73|nr:3-hydroxyacyl-CoA dehydrogenase NAD-binding domain-containing protein [Pusillimonas sp. NJUB218]ROT44499.1 3-hydroxyacyl-CoA dehydrogenase [Pusillimonas sp. NJUB218]